MVRRRRRVHQPAARPRRGAAGLGRDAAFVVEAEPPSLRATVVAYGEQVDGRISGVRFLPDVDDLLEIEPAYVLRGRYSAWKAIICAPDPMGAALAGKIKIQGDLPGLIRHLPYRHVVEKGVRAVPTEFPDGGSGV